MKKKGMAALAVGGGAVALAAAMTVGAAKKDMAFTPAEIEAAQTAWAEGIVAIGATKTEGGDYSARAAEHIRTLYAYGKAPVLFKPTKAAERAVPRYLRRGAFLLRRWGHQGRWRLCH